jgi:plastocyanin domain-containing protein
LLALAAGLLTLGGCKSESAQASDGAGVANSGAPILIEVDGSGYHPEQVAAKSGQLVHLVFKRTTEKGCGDQVVFPSLNIKKDLPVGQEVPIDVTMPASGSLAFTCGMDMYKGSLLVK